jgi:hypothetical protein
MEYLRVSKEWRRWLQEVFQPYPFGNKNSVSQPEFNDILRAFHRREALAYTFGMSTKEFKQMLFGAALLVEEWECPTKKEEPTRQRTVS